MEKSLTGGGRGQRRWVLKSTQEPASGRLAFLKAPHTQGQSYLKGLIIWRGDIWVEGSQNLARL